MSLQEVFPVSHSVMPGSAEARKMTAISGRSCTSALTRSDRLGLLLKMLLESSRWWSKARLLQWRVRPLFSVRVTDYTDTNKEQSSPLNESAEILRQTDMRSSRFLYQLAVLERRTDGTECSSSDTVLLQTPTSVQTCEAPEKMRARARARGYKNGTKYGSLTSQIKYDPRVQTFLKTPCAADSFSQNLKSKGTSGTSGTLGQEILSGYAQAHRGLVVPNPEQMKLKGQFLLIPSASDGLRGLLTMDSLKRHNKKNAELSNLAEQISHKIDGGDSQLSPLFTEEMMGFPLMWTAFPFLLGNGALKA